MVHAATPRSTTTIFPSRQRARDTQPCQIRFICTQLSTRTAQLTTVIVNLKLFELIAICPLSRCATAGSALARKRREFIIRWRHSCARLWPRVTGRRKSPGQTVRSKVAATGPSRCSVRPGSSRGAKTSWRRRTNTTGSPRCPGWIRRLISEKNRPRVRARQQELPHLEPAAARHQHRADPPRPGAPRSADRPRGLAAPRPGLRPVPHGRQQVHAHRLRPAGWPARRGCRGEPAARPATARSAGCIPAGQLALLTAGA